MNRSYFSRRMFSTLTLSIVIEEVDHQAEILC